MADQSRNLRAKMQAEFLPRPSRLDPAGIYSEQDLAHNLGCSTNFFREARTGKLEVQLSLLKAKKEVRLLRPLNLKMKHLLYQASEVLEFLCWLSSANPPMK